ncbi:MAG: response regulator [Chitinophagaceae bacterium]
MYFLLRNNQQTGPFTADELGTKNLKPFDLVWIDGKSAAWRYPGEIEELKRFAPVSEQQSADRMYRQAPGENQNGTSKKNPGIITSHTSADEKAVILEKNDSLFVTAKAGNKNPYNNEPVKKEELSNKKIFSGDIYTSHTPGKSGGLQPRTAAEPRNSKYENLEYNENISTIQKKSAAKDPIRVIIADDHAIFRAGVSASLAQKTDVTLIAEADNGRQLLNLLKNTVPDIILLDIQMPLMDGITALTEIKNLYPHVKVIMLSMHDGHSMISKLMETGANAYLTKTAGSDAIYQAIKTCYEQDYFFNDTTNHALLTELRTIRAGNNETGVVAKKNVVEKPAFNEPVVRSKANPIVKKGRRLQPLWMLAGIIVLTGGGIITGLYLNNNPAEFVNNTPAVTTDNDDAKNDQQVPAVSNASVSPQVAKNKTLASAIDPETTPVSPVVKPVAINTPKEKIIKDNNNNPPIPGSGSNAPADDLTEDRITKNSLVGNKIAVADNDANKINIISQVSVRANKYNKSAFGGVSDIELTVNNNSVYYLDAIVVEVAYSKANDKIIKTENLYFRDIGPGETHIEKAPNSPRGIKIQYKIISIQSKAPGVLFPAN